MLEIVIFNSKNNRKRQEKNEDRWLFCQNLFDENLKSKSIKDVIVLSKR